MHRKPLVATSANLPKGGNFWFFFYPFKRFCILHIAMAEWFCHVTCFNKVIWYCFFFLVQTYFYHKKVVTWRLQHFYHKEVTMLSFLHRWDYCWKCEFDIDVKIENYNHHYGEQLLFYKNVNIKTQRKKKDVLVIFILIVARNEEFQFTW